MRAILTWHSIDASRSPISVTREEFRRQLAWLASSAVRVVGLEDLLGLPDQAAAVALTFDDGFANFETEAAPLLHSHGFPATLFIVTGRVGHDNVWGNGSREDPRIPVLPLLNWDALGRLQEGGITLGAHTRTHRRLALLQDAELEEELGRAAEELEQRLGERPAGLAYPYGEADERVAQHASRYYQWACTTELRALRLHDSRLRLPRLDAWYLRHPALHITWGSFRSRAWIWCRRQARRVRITFSSQEERFQ